jgi:hypothetical protein
MFAVVDYGRVGCRVGIRQTDKQDDPERMSRQIRHLRHTHRVYDAGKKAGTSRSAERACMERSLRGKHQVGSRDVAQHDACVRLGNNAKDLLPGARMRIHGAYMHGRRAVLIDAAV